jgi:hypothetical protein
MSPPARGSRANLPQNPQVSSQLLFFCDGVQCHSLTRALGEFEFVQFIAKCRAFHPGKPLAAVNSPYGNSQFFKCDVCKREFHHMAHHCKVCGWDECQSCFAANTHQIIQSHAIRTLSS